MHPHGPEQEAYAPPIEVSMSQLQSYPNYSLSLAPDSQHFEKKKRLKMLFLSCFLYPSSLKKRQQQPLKEKTCLLEWSENTEHIL